jgi:hypothetical protein
MAGFIPLPPAVSASARTDTTPRRARPRPKPGTDGEGGKVRRNAVAQNGVAMVLLGGRCAAACVGVLGLVGLVWWELGMNGSAVGFE